MKDADHFEELVEAKRVADRKFDKLVTDYRLTQLQYGWRMYRYMDKARTTIEIFEGWVDKLQGSLERMVEEDKHR